MEGDLLMSSPDAMWGQRDPIPNDREPTWELVIRDLERSPWVYSSLVVADARSRDEMGMRKYGTRLQSHNGRDPLKDAYEEALDLAVYLRNCIEEGICMDEEYGLALSLCCSLRAGILERHGS